jgi:hypothetical protein
LPWDPGLKITYQAGQGHAPGVRRAYGTAHVPRMRYDALWQHTTHCRIITATCGRVPTLNNAFAHDPRDQMGHQRFPRRPISMGAHQTQGHHAM